jgi:hypothetical protein
MNPSNAWSPGEGAAVNEFLNTPVGRKWLWILASRKPRVDLSSLEKTAISGAYASGYEAVFNEISSTRSILSPEDPGVKPIDSTKD